MATWYKFDAIGDVSNESIINSTNWSTSDMSSRIITVVQFSIIGSLGILVNILPVIVTAFRYVKWNVVNAMIMNLSCCELVLCVSFVFGQVFFVLWREWLPLGWCNFLSFIHFVAAFASFMFPPLLAINRYVALYYDRHFYEKWYTKNRTAVSMVACWSFCTVIPLLFLIFRQTGFDVDNDHCCMVIREKGWIAMYWLFIIFPLVFFCDGIMVFCNYKIYRKLHKHANQATMVNNVVKDNQELLYFLLADMMFPICFHSVYHIFKFILVNRTSEFLKRFFISLYLVNSILRGGVTIVMLRPYRLAIIRFLTGKGKPSLVHPTSFHGASLKRRSLPDANTNRMNLASPPQQFMDH